jgi:hypothetical protein
MRIRSLASLLFAGVLMIVGSEALAGPPAGQRGAPPAPAKPKDRADDLFDQATAAFDAGRFAEAEAKFEEAWKLKQTHDIAGNLGIVKRRLGKYIEAAQHITWALQHMPPTEGSATRKGLEQELQKARAEVGALRVRVNVDGAAVVVNGREVGVSPVDGDVFVGAGQVTVTARREEYAPARQSFTVAKAEARDVSIVLVPAAAVSERRSVVPGVVLGSVAGVALVTGIGVFAGGRAKGANAGETHDAILKAHNSCVAGAGNYDARCPDVQSTATTANTFQKVGVGLMIGAGAAAAGTILYFVLPQSSSSATKTGALRVLPTVSPGAGGVIFSGTF